MQCYETTKSYYSIFRDGNNWHDVTPARLVTALITERGVCPANEDGIISLFPEYTES